MAARKVKTLLLYEADVKVLSPQVSPAILELPAVKTGLVGPDLEEEIRQAALVVAASDSRKTNHEVSKICHRLGIPVNVADAPEECTFLFPAVVKKGDISIGISTGGGSPVVSSVLRREIEDSMPDYYADIAVQMGRMRKRVRETVPDEKDRRRCLKEAAARAFEHKRTLKDEEIREIIHRQDDSL